jgi:hypothetical protein
MVAGALITYPDQPERAARYIHRALLHVPPCMDASFNPDGAYPEGPMYWHYGTQFNVILIALLESSLGTDFGLTAVPGFATTCDYITAVTAPSGDYYCYADARAHEPHPIVHETAFWFAQRFNHPAWLAPEINILRENPQSTAAPESAEGRLSPLALLWYVAPPNAEITPPFPPIIRQFRGANPLVVCYPQPLQPNSFYFAAKAGSGAVNHSHLDAGSFVLEKNGVRWAVDLGLHDYHTLESQGLDPWQKGATGSRWTVLRYNNFSHSTLSINGLLHNPDGVADFSQFTLTPPPATGFRAVVNMTAPLSSTPLTAATRVFTVDAVTESVVIEDTLTGLPPAANVVWGLTTRAQAEENPERTILPLTQNGKRLTLTFATADPEARWTATDLSLPPDPREDKNPGVWRAGFTVRADNHGAVKITVTLV